MDAPTILKRLRTLQNVVGVLTDPKIVKGAQMAENASLETQRLKSLKTAYGLTDNLEFAYAMITTPVKEPKRTLTR